MTRDQKSAKELADMVAQRIGVSSAAVTVHKDRTFGWRADVYLPPGQVQIPARARFGRAQVMRMPELCRSLAQQRFGGEHLALIVEACARSGVSCRFVRRETDLEPSVVLGAAAE